ncbi:MAG: FAD-dependent oxidoreductase [Gammaproteobacteria bacterium]|nr:FAD-dependent oxidoreductase [Gammaproteobacteria bacterium]MDE0366369.1 FAD-dependent oxidoreductase [Gammaproteobacteria bacterium]
MALYDRLFESVQVGPITIRNRIVRSAHSTGLSEEALIAYHETRGRGGVGMSTIEATSVHPLAPGRIPLWDDACLPVLSRIAERIRPTGMKLLLQLYHPGAGYAEAAGMPEHWSASAVPNPMAGVVPIAMTRSMIDEVVEHFADAARRCRDAGLDGVDIHASSGYLIHEFLSPALNKREDEYGGSFGNRLRFLEEIVAAVRDAVGEAEFAVGVRLPNEDHVPGGLTAADNARIAQAVDGRVDYVSLHMGAYWRFHKLIAPADDPLGAEMPANEVIAPDLASPVMVVGRIMTLDHALHIVDSGAAQMVSMVRALIADPELVNKARRREEHRVRPCLGTNMGCVGQLMTNGRVSCVVNYTNARENALSYEPEDRVQKPKKILVAGGGPAGLEFARNAALRGHEVELREAMRRLGGQVAIAASAPHRADVGAIVGWLEQEIETLGVNVRLNSPVDMAAVESIGPDEVVIATGTTPRSDGFQLSTPAAPVAGFDLPHVHASWDFFGFGPRPEISGSAVVYDDTGSFEAISVADVLLQAGARVTLVSRFDSIGGSLPFPAVTAGAARERLFSGDFDFIGGHYLRGITPKAVEIGVLFTDRARYLEAALVVLVGYNEPNRELAGELAESPLPCHLIGDVRGRNSIMSAMHAGAALGRAI